MTIWIPKLLYHAFPMIYVLLGFLLVAIVPNPVSVFSAICIYVYAYRVLWLRSHGPQCDEIS